MDAGAAAYRDSGVDLEAATAAMAMIRDLARPAEIAQVVTGVGGFAGLISIGGGRVLAAATDGVGTKLEVARLIGKLDTVGIDLVAMCVNDIVCTGAEPLFFLDYIAVGRLVPDQVAAIVEGVTEGCRRAGCTLLGGETAEHPGTIDEGRFDLAGFGVGIADRDRLLSPNSVERGDALIGLPSTGLHSNGYSLVRRVLLKDQPEQALGEFVPALGRTLGEELLEPSAIYVGPLLSLVNLGFVRSAAHITGGGFKENVPRALPPGLGARIRRRSWEQPPIFPLVAKATGIHTYDLYNVLNMGIGMVVVAPAGAEHAVVKECRAAGVQAVVIGDVVEGSGVEFA